jgi:hemolysin III
MKENNHTLQVSEKGITRIDSEKKQKRLRDESFGEHESFGEEIGNTITHGVMAFLILCLMPFAVISAYQRTSGNVILDVIGVSVFCICIIMMLISSTIYHSSKHKTLHKVVLNKLDHIAIFLAIAGTYTPISLSVIGGTQGYILVAIQWTMVLAGVLVKTLMWGKSKLLSVPIYLIMGWSVIIFFQTFKENASPELFWSVLAGGMFYTIGCIFYAGKFKFSHMVFHFFVNAGVASHFVGIVFFLR